MNMAVKMEVIMMMEMATSSILHNFSRLGVYPASFWIKIDPV